MISQLQNVATLSGERQYGNDFYRNTQPRRSQERRSERRESSKRMVWCIMEPRLRRTHFGGLPVRVRTLRPSLRESVGDKRGHYPFSTRFLIRQSSFDGYL